MALESTRVLPWSKVSSARVGAFHEYMRTCIVMYNCTLHGQGASQTPYTAMFGNQATM